MDAKRKQDLPEALVDKFMINRAYPTFKPDGRFVGLVKGKPPPPLAAELLIALVVPDMQQPRLFASWLASAAVNNDAVTMRLLLAALARRLPADTTLDVYSAWLGDAYQMHTDNPALRAALEHGNQEALDVLLQDTSGMVSAAYIPNVRLKWYDLLRGRPHMVQQLLEQYYWNDLAQLTSMATMVREIRRTGQWPKDTRSSDNLHALEKKIHARLLVLVGQ
jgi:hypothetical protein